MKRFSTRSFARLLAALALGMLAASPARAGSTPAPPKFRLPSEVAAPVRYAVDLTIVPDHDTFTGVIDIDLNFKQSSPILWLNAEKVAVNSATLSAGGQEVAVEVIPTPKDYVGFAFARQVGPGAARLHVSYQGEISRKDMQGIFQVKDSGQWYVYSQFEALGARRAYPCFDEPGYKVPWQLTLHVKKDQVALSNTPIVSETDTGDGMKTVKFVETPPLPSYLVALTVGDEDIVDAGTTGKKHTKVRIVVPHGRAAEAKYAAQTTPDIVNLLEKYFGIPYPYDKLDEVAIPLFGGAMENPGLVTFGTSIITVKPENDTLNRHREWVSVAAHELSHQWFGDLVTTAWWDDIWLNEGFASWMGNKIVNEYHPEWNMNISEVNAYQGAMESDGLVSARRVRQPVESNDDITNAFDGITYSKGSALLNMFESYMGPAKFREGIQRYLKKYSWGSATSAEFLAALAGDDSAIASAFSGFLDQPGVPLVTAALDCQGGDAKVDLSQQRFLPLGSSGAVPELWNVPVCVRYASGSGEARQCALFGEKSYEMALTKATGCPGWIDANAGADGYYRVLYQSDLLGSLLKDGGQRLSLAERVSLIGDIYALTRSGKMPLGRALGLAPALAQDSARQVVTKTMEITTGLGDNLVEPGLLPRYRQYLVNVYGARARDLGWASRPGESDDNRLLRPSLEGVLANQAEDPQAIAEAENLAIAWLGDHKAVQPDMVGVVLTTAARHGDRQLFDRMRLAARQEKNEDFRGTLLFSLGLVSEKDIATAAMPIVLTDEFDNRESLGILFGVSQSPKTRDLAYSFVKENWDALVAKLPTDTGAFLPYVAAGYCDPQHRQDVQSFFEGRSTKYTGGPRTLAQVLEGIDLCVAYKTAQAPSVAEFLQNYGANSTAAGGAAGLPVDSSGAQGLWEEAIAAKGGHERLLGVKSLLLSLQTTQGHGRHWRDITIRELLVYPDKEWVYGDERPTVFGFNIDVWNGERQVYWSLAQNPGLPPQFGCLNKPPFPANPQEDIVETQLVHLMETRWFRPEPVSAYRARWGAYEHVDAVETVAGIHKVDYYLDEKTHLPVQVVIHATPYHDPIWSLTYTFRLRNYIEVEGIQMPSVIDANRTLGSGHEEYHYEINVDYDPEIFNRPPQVGDGPDAWRLKSAHSKGDH